MLNWLTKGLRLRAALFLAVAYALCVIAPPVALAFSDGAVATNCLFEEHTAAPHVHARSGPGHVTGQVHADNVSHDHVRVAAPIKGIDDQQGSQTESCCGLFSGPAVSSNESAFLVEHVSNAPVLALLDRDLDGRGPDRLLRPPRAL